MNEHRIWVVDELAEPAVLGKIRKMLVNAWRANPAVPASVRSEIEIAASEVAANIVEHACGSRVVHLRMEVVILADEVQVRFVDDGHAAKIDLDSVHLPHDMAERGRGLAVARAVLRHLSYQRAEGRNRWTLLSERFSV